MAHILVLRSEFEGGMTSTVRGVFCYLVNDAGLSVAELPLRGFGAVVVGGSRGIGAAVAALLAELGAGVVVNGRDPEPVEATVSSIVANGGQAVGLPGSASDGAVAEGLIS